MLRNLNPVVKQLLIANILVYILSIFMPNNYELFSLHYFESPKFTWWQPFTHMFMHAPMPSFFHILFNMLGLLMLGNALEHYWGGTRFLFFYLACGLGAAFVQMGFNYFEIMQLKSQISIPLTPSELQTILSSDFVSNGMFTSQLLYENNLEIFQKYPAISADDFDAIAKATNIFQGTAVGASGAIYGLLVAFAFMFPNAELMLIFFPIPIKAKYFVPLIVAIDLFSGITGFSLFMGGNIAHFAHVGGAAIGFILMLLWRNNKFNHTRWN